MTGLRTVEPDQIQSANSSGGPAAPARAPHHQTCDFPHPTLETEDDLCRRRFPPQDEPVTYQDVVARGGLQDLAPVYRQLHVHLLSYV